MLRDEIKPYIDSMGLVAPAKVVPNTGRASDNGVMFTSEYLIMLIRNNEAHASNLIDMLNVLLNCMPTPGLLSRAPGDPDQEGPDDYIGLAAALCEIRILDGSSGLTKFLQLKAEAMAQSVVRYGLMHFGYMDNAKTGKWSWSAFLGRQPQLTAAFLWASGYPVGPLLRVYCAISILAASRPLSVDNTDSRRLSWLLVQIASPRSFICRLAAKVWYNRLYKDYLNGMKDVAKIYYEPGHPFATYWKDKP